MKKRAERRHKMKGKMKEKIKGSRENEEKSR